MKTPVAFMQRALSLAAKGRPHVSPNPMVGCVLTRGQQIVGEGFHERFGGPHAEINALRKAGARAKGSTAYLTLEPCTHWGKTPPCAPDLVRVGIKKVVLAMTDPNPNVSGRGVAFLKRRGIQVSVGLLEREARLLNRRFLTWIEKKRAHVVLKMAMTLDGKIASRTGSSKWISNEKSRARVHALRAESDAILVGARTANVDNPTLTSHGTGKNPIRLILDQNGRARRSLKLLRDGLAPTEIVTTPVDELVVHLRERGLSQLLVEGGGETAWKFLERDLIDEVCFFVAPTLLGGRSAKTPVEGVGYETVEMGKRFRTIDIETIDGDVMISAVRDN